MDDANTDERLRVTFMLSYTCSHLSWTSGDLARHSSTASNGRFSRHSTDPRDLIKNTVAACT
eukprot:38167-Eustigmatos_ZCMA.PRE.1